MADSLLNAKELSELWLRRLEPGGRAVSRDLNGYRRYTPEDVEYIKTVLFSREHPVPRAAER